jgi:GTP pyrophosphokinase
VSLKEMESRAGQLGKEMMLRRFKNRKIDVDDAAVSRLVKKMGYKTITEFYSAISDGRLDVNAVIDAYLDADRKPTDEPAPASADTFVLHQHPENADTGRESSDVVIIGEGIKGINYRLARCCNPIYGDDVFGFISAEGVIKIHRNDCPNAANIRERYPYRVINTRWSGKIGAQFAVTLRIVGRDDVGVVTKISSIINKESSTTLRNISIESNGGLFQGFVIIGITNREMLNQLITKIKTVKGVKDVQQA